MPRKQLFADSDHSAFTEHGDASTCSNFLDLDWLSSSGNSCEEEMYERLVFFIQLQEFHQELLLSDSFCYI